MITSAAPDYYEVLQVSPNAEPETIHRVYRMLAQRYHPDNRESGDEARFRRLVDAYQLLTDPERRAQYDVGYHELRKTRVQTTTPIPRNDNWIEIEQLIRVTVLEVLYHRRRMEPIRAGVYILDLEQLTGHPREHLDFTLWYLTKKNFVNSEDGSKLSITADGVDYFESQHLLHYARKRLEGREPQ